ncbi:S41 family peptidase [Mucilaginibacter psychrotolerans]|uniref:Peptidase S41 n=1 Tax=Mucilaginibacter psychrotolerans TaxID=1524096 RepID=A0A4Y8SNG7_9SPHI|nr:S41 family peptidase [Mucilaginibacter psychrotolerans]TFF40117.1 peptidase S41 [Mucilaginibacter psychrotolerans]
MNRLNITLSLVMVLAIGTTNAQTAKLTKKVKSETVASISTSLKANYIYLDTALKMGDFIQGQLKSGRYDTIQTQAVFAAILTSDLLSVYHDGHLSISYDPLFSSANGKTDTIMEKERMLKFRKRVNFGFDKAEILPGNIGYLKIGGFFEPDSAAKVMTLAAFRFVSNSGALIIDLRSNMGGDPRMVSFICGLFFNQQTHLNDLYSRKDKSTTTYWSSPDTIIKGFYNMPIYILTSKHTFSAGEELTYDLQTQKRAVIIGETTAGGAHPVQPFSVGNGFVANVPFARAINPITKSDWETVGVKPDKDIPADQALDFAIRMVNHK